MASDPKVAKNFRLSEFVCPCCGAVKLNSDLPVGLQDLRDMLGSPISITSGYRCPVHNKKIGGAKFSRHMRGLAADCFFPGKSLLDAYLCIVQLWPWSDGGGIGLYPKWTDKKGKVRGNFIHLDTGDKRTRWAEIKGKRVSFDKALLELKGSEND